MWLCVRRFISYVTLSEWLTQLGDPGRRLDSTQEVPDDEKAESANGSTLLFVGRSVISHEVVHVVVAAPGFARKQILQVITGQLVSITVHIKYKRDVQGDPAGR